jgi:hypothetical protein
MGITPMQRLFIQSARISFHEVNMPVPYSEIPTPITHPGTSRVKIVEITGCLVAGVFHNQGIPL